MSKTGYSMYNWDAYGYQLCVSSNNAGRHEMIDWCREQFGECDWLSVGDFGAWDLSTVYRFKSVEDAMGFKLMWEE